MWKHYKLAIGTDWAGENILVIAHDREHVTVHGAHGLTRDITIDPTRTYQPNGLLAGRRPKQNRQQ